MRWHIKAFISHADYVERDDGFKLPEGWEPMMVERLDGNRYRIVARKLVTA